MNKSSIYITLLALACSSAGNDETSESGSNAIRGEGRSDQGSGQQASPEDDQSGDRGGPTGQGGPDGDWGPGPNGAPDGAPTGGDHRGNGAPGMGDGDCPGSAGAGDGGNGEGGASDGAPIAEPR
jgi:hypothetical protein